MKFLVYSQMTVSKFVGEIEADSEEEARDLAYSTEFPRDQGSLCHYCTSSVGDAGDPEFVVEEAK